MSGRGDSEETRSILLIILPEGGSKNAMNTLDTTKRSEKQVKCKHASGGRRQGMLR